MAKRAWSWADVKPRPAAKAARSGKPAAVQRGTAGAVAPPAGGSPAAAGCSCPPALLGARCSCAPGAGTVERRVTVGRHLIVFMVCGCAAERRWTVLP